MNRLADETSPYLRQHAANPVDWYPWGADAFTRARADDKPVLLSVGYAACHWCHVMAHESFDDAETARLMNERFVNIKVDREERPDVDAIYMAAVQAMTGHGGWPMTVFLTPDGVPFYAGTYFPPDDAHGMPSFRRVLSSVANAYRDRRPDVEDTAARMRRFYAGVEAGFPRDGTLDASLLNAACRTIASHHDAEHGGFGDAPKFPQAMTLDFVLRSWRYGAAPDGLELVLRAFRAMARGGIYDQLGGGFHRYSVDAAWLVPHFEKMLYDNALLARLGAHLVQATGDPEVQRVTTETVDWVAREMTSPEGGFYASLDADSNGVEGEFYLWTRAELEARLGADADVAAAYWDVTGAGNFEGRSILHVPRDPTAVARQLGMPADELSERIARIRATLVAARDARVHPARDEKVLASWNGLMLRAVAGCARVFERDDYRALAVRNGEFLFRTLVDGGRVQRAWTAGSVRSPGYLEDQAAVALGALALYELTFDTQWLERAHVVATAMVDRFWDADAGAFFDTAVDHEALIARPREIADNAVPSGTALAIELLLRLGDVLGDAGLRARADTALSPLASIMASHPQAFGYLLGVADLALRGPVEVALVGESGSPSFRSLERAVASTYVPGLVLAGGLGGWPALLRDRPLGNAATAYVCRAYACDEPTTSPERLRAQLETAVHVQPA